jgi:hypothetical protein
MLLSLKTDDLSVYIHLANYRLAPVAPPGPRACALHTRECRNTPASAYSLTLTQTAVHTWIPGTRVSTNKKSD